MELQVRAVTCIWCEETMTYKTDDSKAEIYEIMKKHDLICEKHPLQEKIAAFRELLEKCEWFAGKCPVCFQKYEHTPDCALAKQLKS